MGNQAQATIRNKSNQAETITQEMFNQLPDSLKAMYEVVQPAAGTPAVIKLETDEQYKKMTKGNLKALNKGFGDLIDMNQDTIKITSIKMQTSKASGNRMAVIKQFQSIATGKKYDRNVYLSPNQMYFLAARAGKLFSNGVAVNEEQLENAPDEQVLEIVSTDFTVEAKVVANDNRWDFDRNAL